MFSSSSSPQNTSPCSIISQSKTSDTTHSVSYRTPSAKRWILLPSLESLDESSHAFPSVFLSPYTKSSLCSFLLALSTSSDSHNSGTVSSVSTLDLLSLSISMKSRNVSGNLDDQLQASSGGSLAAMLTRTLRSLLSFKKPAVRFVTSSRNVLQSSGKEWKRGAMRKAASNADASSADASAWVSLQAPGDGNVHGLEVEHSGKTQNSSKDESELKENFSQLRLDKIQKISKYLLAGAVSTIVARTIVAPLERLKLEYIVGGAKHNWVKVIQGIWVAEGPGGFWKGNVLNLLRMVPFKSINFLTYDMFCKEIVERQGKERATNFDRLTAGAASGAVATLTCFPLDTIRTRLIAPGGEALGGMLGCFHQMIHREGLFSLYKGLFPALLSMVPAGAVFYGVYDILKAAYLKSPKAQRELLMLMEIERETGCPMHGNESEKTSAQLELDPVRTLIYGAIAGACAEIITYPLEVVRRQLQLQQTTAKMGLIAAFQIIIERDGLSALFSGVVPSTVQVLPSAAVSYLVYESLKAMLKIS